MLLICMFYRAIGDKVEQRVQHLQLFQLKLTQMCTALVTCTGLGPVNEGSSDCNTLQGLMGNTRKMHTVCINDQFCMDTYDVREEQINFVSR